MNTEESKCWSCEQGYLFLGEEIPKEPYICEECDIE